MPWVKKIKTYLTKVSNGTLIKNAEVTQDRPLPGKPPPKQQNHQKTRGTISREHKQKNKS